MPDINEFDSMERKAPLLLLVGKSGSGKSTIADELEKRYGLKVLRSYTTRPPRDNDTTHIFVTGEEFDKLEDIVAYTEYNGYRYCATGSQIDESDVYVIDPAGVEFLKNTYTGKKRPIDIFIKSGKRTRENRMKKRGDSPEKIQERLAYDEEVFKGYEPYADTRNSDEQIDKTVTTVNNPPLNAKAYEVEASV